VKLDIPRIVSSLLRNKDVSPLCCCSSGLEDPVGEEGKIGRSNPLNIGLDLLFARVAYLPPYLPSVVG